MWCFGQYEPLICFALSKHLESRVKANSHRGALWGCDISVEAIEIFYVQADIILVCPF